MAGSFPDLAGPLYGASWGRAIARFFAKYATFAGRASRSEYWWWVLTNALVGVVLAAVARSEGDDLAFSVWPTPYLTWSAPAGGGPATTVTAGIAVVYSLATFLPSLALVWRRLHDTDRSGGWFFFGLIPLVGPIVLLVFTLGGPRPEGARFDDPPRPTREPRAEP